MSADEDIISVVIVNFNAGGYLVATVQSVLAQNQAVEIVVVDNNSEDDSIALLRHRFSEEDVYVIRLESDSKLSV